VKFVKTATIKSFRLETHNREHVLVYREEVNHYFCGPTIEENNKQEKCTIILHHQQQQPVKNLALHITTG
jgi:hypothetical protein